MIEIRALKGVSIARSNDETRAYLTGVMVCAHTEANAGSLYDETRKGQALLVATDGHRMVVGLGMPIGAADIEAVLPAGVSVEPHNPEVWEETIIPGDMVKNILRVKVDKAYKNLAGSQFFWLHRDGDALRAVFYDGQVVTGKAINATYPDWKRVLTPCLAYKDAPSCVNGMGFRAGYLADLDVFAYAFGHPKTGAVQMFGNADNAAAPVVFEAKSPDQHKGYYLLMPMRM